MRTSETWGSRWRGVLPSKSNACCGLRGGLGYDVIPHAGFGFGNFFVYANGGGEVRSGFNLPNDFGSFTIRPGCESNASFDERNPRFFRPRHRVGLHVFAAVAGKAVMRNILLDGNTLKDSHRVDKKPFTADLLGGVSLIVYRFKLKYALVYRTKEFETQEEEELFGSITLSVSY